MPWPRTALRPGHDAPRTAAQPGREAPAERAPSTGGPPAADAGPAGPDGHPQSQSDNPVLEPLFRAVRANHPKADLALLERAYLTAEQMHGAQMRKSGDPYITHPLAVTTILADIGMTEPTLVAALLHDTVEDTPYTLDAAARRLRRRGRACSSTASPSSTRSSTATPPRPRRSAR